MKNSKLFFLWLTVFSLVGCHNRGCMIADEHFDSLSGRDTKKQVAPAPQVTPAQKEASAPQKATASERGKILRVTEPLESSVVTNPVKLCFSIGGGYAVEPARNGDNEGKGHHHVLVDVPIPPESTLTHPMVKDANHIHLGDGSTCKSINLSKGVHTIRGVFSYGSHRLYVPVITDAVFFYVK
jgi:hypothetical protein